LLSDGASLIYTTPHIPSQLQGLVHACLSITSLLKKQPLKANVIDRDKILVPPNWDSWGKILVLRDGFDVESVSKAWSEDIQKDWPPPPPKPEGGLENGEKKEGEEEEEAEAEPKPPSAVEMFEEWVPDATTGGLSLGAPGIGHSTPEVEIDKTQEFLSTQAGLLEASKRKADAEAKGKSATERRYDEEQKTDSAVMDHIGPVQFNMGGIQVDADDMLQRIKVRGANLDQIELIRHAACGAALLLTYTLQERRDSTPDPTTPTTEAVGGNPEASRAVPKNHGLQFFFFFFFVFCPRGPNGKLFRFLSPGMRRDILLCPSTQIPSRRNLGLVVGQKPWRTRWSCFW
jgi:hypothetical protein